MILINKLSITIEKINIFFNFLIGIGAFSGGIMALVPGLTEKMGLYSSSLKYAPFKSFIIPGLFLLIVLCGGNILNGFFFFKKRENSPYLLAVMGIILMAWIIIQCLFMLGIAPPHIIFFLLGIEQFIGGFFLIKKSKVRFPFSAKQN